MCLFKTGALVIYTLALGVLANPARADSGSPLPTRSFADMQQHWAKDCVNRLSASRQISGYPNGQFRPEAQVTRAEFAVLMLNSFPTLIQSTPQLTRSFRDVRRDYWAYWALQTAYQKGIFVGYPDGTMRPDRSISRVEAIATLVSLVNRTNDVYDAGFYPSYSMLMRCSERYLLISIKFLLGQKRQFFVTFFQALFKLIISWVN
ncbi:MAG: S-layer homology domain [Phormidesmis priestleyi Ana]|uniref:S-layer homology domain n=1 Tax=Phormidesmis priestleyi Ana TaxID=1666911 RepID=A0A0P7YQY7_9CYAN|nr:MAG: S-layer homology domain [Phormidesmis priestleyi Ana]